jgi:DNA repair exonuclease SbcCD ATPase subunit
MLEIESLTMQNFLSVGNVTQSISFKNPEMFLVLGENLDLGGADNRNGVGKTAIINALSFALYGKPLVKIKLDNLVNKTNGKNMLVSIEFIKDGKRYKIVRGRKPAKFQFLVVEDEDQVVEVVESDETLGENRLTQEDVEKVLGIGHEMFKHIVALNTYTEPFLSLPVAGQREIIEQLLGITQLSERAESLKELIKTSKDAISQEEFRISAIKEANKRIETNIEDQKRKSEDWVTRHEERMMSLTLQINKLTKLNIDDELAKHNKVKEINDIQTEYASIEKDKKLLVAEKQNVERKISKLSSQLHKVEGGECHTCGQSLDSEIHADLEKTITKEVEALNKELFAVIAGIEEFTSVLDGIVIPPTPETFYSSIDDVYNHKSKIESLESALLREAEEENPHTDSIETLIQTGLQEIDYTVLNETTELKKHQDFLLKLLTNKDSFVRKTIISQNLAFLNHKLAEYLNALGLPHSVTFMPDLAVEILDHGRDLDFDNLSRGERTRLILSLSWAFRDVYENLGSPINLLFIDELADNGLDINGVNSALRILKNMTRERNRCIHLISHRDELMGRVDNVVRVIKENGFTTLDSNAVGVDRSGVL